MGRDQWKPCTAAHVRERTSSPMWLLPQLQQIDTMLSGRWDWWMRILLRGELKDDKIPKIDFIHNPSTEPKTRYASDQLTELVGSGADIKKQFLMIVNRARLQGQDLCKLLQWFLYGLEPIGTVERPKLHDEIEVLMYQEGVNCLCRMMAIPGDWGSAIMGEMFDGGKSGTAWFPTPGSIVDLMCSLTFRDEIDARTTSLYEPCVGTGVILLYGSNYCLDLYANDVDPLMVAWARLQCYLYVPWAVYGNKMNIREIRERREQERIACKKSNRPPPKKVKLRK